MIPTLTQQQPVLVYNRISGNSRKIVLMVALSVASFVPFVLGFSIGFSEWFVYNFGTHPSTRSIRSEVAATGMNKANVEEEVERRVAIEEARYEEANDKLRSQLTGGIFLGLVILLELLFWSVSRSSTARLLELSGARPASSTQSEERVRTLMSKLVERAGITEPRLYIMDSPVPNAFAAGMRPSDSAIVVSEGLIKLLDDQELQGVLAHEISHIANHDTRLNTVVASISLFLRLPYLIRKKNRELKRLQQHHNALARRGRNAFKIALSPLYLYLFFVAPLLAAVIRAASSRTREYIADVDAVVLALDAEGLMRALAKIAGAGSAEPNASPLMSHAYFADPVPKGGSLGLLRSRVLGTHPSMQNRIDRLIELNGETPLSIIEGAVKAGREFGREHPPIESADAAHTIGRNELSALTVGAPTGRVFRVLSETPVYDSANRSSHVVARIPAGGFVVVFDDPGAFHSVLTQDETFGYVVSSAKMQRVDLLPAEIHDPAARQRAERQLAAAAADPGAQPTLTPTQLVIAIAFAVVVFAGIMIVLLQLGK